MIPNPIVSKHEGKVKDTYVEPDVWTTTVKIDDVRTEEWHGKKSYTSYRVNVITTYPKFGGGSFSVRRRYNDFVWLIQHIESDLSKQKFKRPIERLPELPGDTISSFFGWGRFDDDFIEDRRKKLEVFMNKLCNHPQCCQNEGLIRFLTEDDVKAVMNFYQM